MLKMTLRILLRLLSQDRADEDLAALPAWLDSQEAVSD